ncbi:MAG TPA: hypothetical protein VF972_12350 [Actinomycetota bacterium]
MAVNSGRVQFGTPHKSKTPKISPHGRVCRADGCTTVLSIYNDAAECSMHELRMVKSAPRRP